ncbi:hypothetical protein BRC88_14380 [Halobacteriales archaeon QS_4_69_225]|nr:MAG: hypothetical protein BRC88_14380 [Halobacteriales archaeon QS_4_69_225]
MPKDTEACGRCSMTVVVDAVDEEGEEGASDRDPFGEDRIEVDRRAMDRVSPAAWVGRLSTRLDEVVGRLAWRR